MTKATMKVVIDACERYPVYSVYLEDPKDIIMFGRAAELTQEEHIRYCRIRTEFDDMQDLLARRFKEAKE